MLSLTKEAGTFFEPGEIEGGEGFGGKQQAQQIAHHLGMGEETFVEVVLFAHEQSFEGYPFPSAGRFARGSCYRRGRRVAKSAGRSPGPQRDARREAAGIGSV